MRTTKSRSRRTLHHRQKYTETIEKTLKYYLFSAPDLLPLLNQGQMKLV